MNCLRKEFPTASVGALCSLFGLTRQAYYKAEKRASKRVLQEALVLQEVRKIKQEQPQLGTEKVYLLIKPFLQEHSIKMGRDKLYDLLRAHHLLPKRKRRGPGTTQSKHLFYKHPNLVKDLEVLRPGFVWTSDITYIRCGGDRFSYLSLITDAYSKKIVGWSLQPSLRAEGPIEALKMALRSINQRERNRVHGGYSHSPTPLIHHSDRGIQYCCYQYVGLLEKYQVQISMARESYENPIAERVNGILKEELLRPGYPDQASAKMAIAKAIRIYNEKRPHRSLNMMMPVQAHQMSGPIPKRWKKNKYREKARKRREAEHQSQKSTASEKKKQSQISI